MAVVDYNAMYVNLHKTPPGWLTTDEVRSFFNVRCRETMKKRLKWLEQVGGTVEQALQPYRRSDGIIQSVLHYRLTPPTKGKPCPAASPAGRSKKKPTRRGRCGIGSRTSGKRG